MRNVFVCACLCVRVCVCVCVRAHDSKLLSQQTTRSVWVFGCTLRPDTISPYSLGTAPWGLSWLLQDIDTPLLSDTALSDRNRLNQTDHGLQTTDSIVRAGHELVCLVLGWDPSTACALLEFAEAPTRILRFLYTVDIGITTTTSPALDIAALCLDS